MPGIKVDQGAKPLAFAPDESVTDGLDGLRERLAEYRELGARFTKWRAVLKIGPGQPSDYCIAVNAHVLARFAALSQEAGLVPIVEPEVLAEGEHTREQSFEATLRAQRSVFAELAAQRVSLERSRTRSSRRGEAMRRTLRRRRPPLRNAQGKTGWHSGGSSIESRVRRASFSAISGAFQRARAG